MVATAPRGNAEVEPTRMKFAALGGGTLALEGIIWSSWGGRPATGSAMLEKVKDGEFEDKFTVRVVLSKLNSECGAPLYRKVTIFHEGEGEYFPIECPMIKYTEVVGARKATLLLKRDFGVSGRCVATGQAGFYECRADLPKAGRSRIGVSVTGSGQSVTITHCEPVVKKPNEVAFCALRRLPG
jgi:hypothetical protein